VATFREADFHVSNLYTFSLHRHCAADSSYPIADRLSDQTLNLWVADQVDVEYVERCAKAVLEAIKSIERPS
jgi:dTDP-4-amino-4,6-dideoxygalactose transaminase